MDLGLVASYLPDEFEQIARRDGGGNGRQVGDPFRGSMARLYFHRSWTGFCIYGLQFNLDGDHATVTESWMNRDPVQCRGTSIEHDQAMVQFLVDALKLGKPTVLPSRRARR